MAKPMVFTVGVQAVLMLSVLRFIFTDSLSTCPLLLHLPTMPTMNETILAESYTFLDYIYELSDRGNIGVNEAFRSTSGLQQTVSAIISLWDNYYGQFSNSTYDANFIENVPYFYLLNVELNSIQTFRSTYLDILLDDKDDGDSQEVKRDHCVTFQLENETALVLTKCASSSTFHRDNSTTRALAPPCAVISTLAGLQKQQNWLFLNDFVQFNQQREQLSRTIVPHMFLDDSSYRSSIAAIMKNGFSNSFFFESSVFNIPTIHSAALSLVAYFSEFVQRNYILVLFEMNGDDIENFLLSKVFEDEAKKVGIHVESYGYSNNIKGSLSRMLNKVKNTGFRTILVLHNHQLRESIMNFGKSAVDAGIVGEEYMWIIHQDRDYLNYAEQEEAIIFLNNDGTNTKTDDNSASMSHFVRGLGIHSVNYSPIYSSHSSPFNDLDESVAEDFEAFLSMLDGQCKNAEKYVDAHCTFRLGDLLDYNRTANAFLFFVRSSALATYAYDGVTALLEAKDDSCNAALFNNDYNTGNSFVSSMSLCDERNITMANLYEDQFLGIANLGEISFDPLTHLRSNKSIGFRMINFQPMKHQTERNGYSYSAYKLSVTGINDRSHRWTDYGLDKYMYYDGSNFPPLPDYRVSEEKNYFRNDYRGIVLICSFASFVVTLCAIFCLCRCQHNLNSGISFSSWSFELIGLRFIAMLLLFGVISCIGSVVLLHDESVPYISSKEQMDSICLLNCLMILISMDGFPMLYLLKFASLHYDLLPSSASLFFPFSNFHERRRTLIRLFSVCLYALVTVWKDFRLSKLVSFQWERKVISRDEYGFVNETRGSCVGLEPVDRHVLAGQVFLYVLSCAIVLCFIRLCMHEIKALPRNSLNFSCSDRYLEDFKCLCTAAHVDISLVIVFMIFRAITKLSTNHSAFLVSLHLLLRYQIHFHNIIWKKVANSTRTMMQTEVSGEGIDNDDNHSILSDIAIS